MRLLPWSYGVRNLGRAPLRTALSVAGSCMVVLLVLSAAAFVRGMTRSLTISGSPGNVILLGAGSEESIERSEVSPSVAQQAVASIPGIKTRLGMHYVSQEIHMAAMLRSSRRDERGSMAMLRGVTLSAFLVHPQVRLVQGRTAGPGEVIVGRLAATRMGLEASQLALGSTLWFDQQRLTVVGLFEAPGTVMAAEIWMPLYDLQIAAKREFISCVVVTLDAAEFADVDLFTKQRLDLELVAISEDIYYAKLSQFYRPVYWMVWVTAVMIAMGGLFGGLNTLFAAFAARIRELGSLQAIGFSRLAILVSVVQESVLSSVTGALIAALVGVTLLDGLAVRFSMGAFGLVVDAPVMAGALAAGLALGVLGALPPGWHCLKRPINESLKAI